MRFKSILFAACVLLLTGTAASAEEKTDGPGEDVKALSGMSIVGNDEAPKSLYIVPWKSSEIGTETGLSMLRARDVNAPVDREVFSRKLHYYKISISHDNGR